MNRREFVKVAAVSVILTGGTGAASARSKVPSDLVVEMEASIKAAFGSGFEVNELVRQGTGYLARAVHLGNEFFVASDDGKTWTVLRSTNP